MVDLNRFSDEPHQCNPIKVFNVYSSQLLSNVESLVIIHTARKFDFITLMPKLRITLMLTLIHCKHTSDQAADILSVIRNILEKRNTSHIESAFTIKVESDKASKIFSPHNDKNSSIELLSIR